MPILRFIGFAILFLACSGESVLGGKDASLPVDLMVQPTEVFDDRADRPAQMLDRSEPVDSDLMSDRKPGLPEREDLVDRQAPSDSDDGGQDGVDGDGPSMDLIVDAVPEDSVLQDRADVQSEATPVSDSAPDGIDSGRCGVIGLPCCWSGNSQCEGDSTCRGSFPGTCACGGRSEPCCPGFVCQSQTGLVLTCRLQGSRRLCVL